MGPKEPYWTQKRVRGIGRFVWETIGIIGSIALAALIASVAIAGAMIVAVPKEGERLVGFEVYLAEAFPWGLIGAIAFGAAFHIGRFIYNRLPEGK